MSRSLFRAVVFGAAFAFVGWLLSAVGLALFLALPIALVVMVVGISMPMVGVKALDAAIDAARAWIWRNEQGRHHSFDGVLLDIQDDGRHVWIGTKGMRTVLGMTDSDARLMGRHAGRTRLDDEGELMLRVDTLVDYLASGTTSRDPRRLRFRRFLERDVLFPAAERRRRSERIQ